MSSPQVDIKAQIDSVAGKDLVHALGAYIYVNFSWNEEALDTASKLLTMNYGERATNSVLAEVTNVLKPILEQEQMSFTDREALRGELSNYIYEKYIAPHIKEEAQRRLTSASEEDRRVLVAASAVIVTSVNAKRLGLYVNYDFTSESIYVNITKMKIGGKTVEVIGVSSADSDTFSNVVSAVLQSKVQYVWDIFAKYLLGVSYAWSSRRHFYMNLLIFPDTWPLVETLAAEFLTAIETAHPQAAPQTSTAATQAARAPEAGHAEPTLREPAACSPERLKVRRGRDVLEDVVAAVLEDLGFYVEVDKQVGTKSGTTVEIDVWGVKAIGDSRFYVYASCKNLERPVDVSVVREEVGRVEQMLGSPQIPGIPHVRILVTSSIQDSAKKEALANGFVVVEVGRKVDESNAEEACRQIYDRLNAVFVGMAPTWLQELASLADELRGSLQELEVLDSRLRGVADRLIYLLQQRSR